MTGQDSEAVLRELIDAAGELAAAEKAYRHAHDHFGDGHINSGRAWDRMRKAGIEATNKVAYAKAALASPTAPAGGGTVARMLMAYHAAFDNDPGMREDDAMRAALEAAHPQPAEQAASSWAADDFYSGHPLPVLHDDPTINLELLVQALTARLDTARRALADAAAMQVVQPTLQQVKTNAAWAMDETDPRRLLPRSVQYAEQAASSGEAQRDRCEDCHEPVGSRICATCAEMRATTPPPAGPVASLAGEPMAVIDRKGFSIGSPYLTSEGIKADLPDGTLLYTRPAAGEDAK